MWLSDSIGFIKERRQKRCPRRIIRQKLLSQTELVLVVASVAAVEVVKVLAGVIGSGSRGGSVGWLAGWLRGWL